MFIGIFRLWLTLIFVVCFLFEAWMNHRTKMEFNFTFTENHMVGSSFYKSFIKMPKLKSWFHYFFAFGSQCKIFISFECIFCIRFHMYKQLSKKNLTYVMSGCLFNLNQTSPNFCMLIFITSDCFQIINELNQYHKPTILTL